MHIVRTSQAVFWFARNLPIETVGGGAGTMRGMNTALIAITPRAIGATSTPTVDARELHAFLKVGKDFSTWLKSRIAQYGFVDGLDFVEVFPKTGENYAGGRPSKEYALTLNMAKELSMVERNAKGKQARQYFIECERRARKGVVQAQDPQIAAMVLALMEIDGVKQEQQRQSEAMERLKEDVAVIEARTQPENCHFTVMGYARLHGKTLNLPQASQLGKRCANLSRERGLPIGNVTDPRFGKLNTYHDSVLARVLGMD